MSPEPTGRFSLPSDQEKIEAALAWASRLENGFEPDRYDPFMVNLARGYRELREENARLNVIADLVDVGGDVVDELRVARGRLADLEQMLGDLVAVDLRPADVLIFDGTSYKIVNEQGYRQVGRLIDRAALLLGRAVGSEGDTSLG